MSTKDEAAFEAAFATARGDELPTEVIEQEEQAGIVEQADEVVDGAQTEEQVIEAEQKAIADVEQILAKVADNENLTNAEIRKIYGKFGELTQQVNALKQGGKGKLVIPDSFREEYPDVAAMMESVEVEGVAGVSAEIPDVTKLLEDRVTEITRNFETKLLGVMHPDWQEITAMPEFLDWAGKQDKETIDLLNNGWDGVAVGKKLTEFKKSLAEMQAQQQGNKAQQAPQKQDKTSRLEAALQPEGRSTGRQSVSEEDEFAKGFSAVRGT